MQYHVSISDIDTVTKSPDFWTDTQLRALLDTYGVENVEEISAKELLDYVALVTSDLEPAEAAAVALRFVFDKEELNEHQIEQISHDMLEDKVVEEYPEIAYHERLWHVNQLLYGAFNGKFPNTKASVITCVITPKAGSDQVLAKADVLRLLGPGLRDHAILPRLYEERLAGTIDFPEADSILWQLKTSGEHQYTLMTSEYWLGAEDFGAREFESTLPEQD